MFMFSANKSGSVFGPIGLQRAGAGVRDRAQAYKPTHEQIALAAYEIYVASGWVQGQSTENWLEAERALGALGQVASQTQPQDVGARAPRTAYPN